MAFDWLLQAKGLTGLFSRRPWPSPGLDVMGDTRHRIRWQSRVRSLSSPVHGQSWSLVCAGRGLHLSLEAQQRTGNCMLQKGLSKSHCRALLTIGCKYKNSSQTIEIPEGRSLCGASLHKHRVQCCCEIVFFRAVTTPRGCSLQAGPAAFRLGLLSQGD